MKLPAFRIRLQVDASKLEGITETLNGGSPEWPNGSALQFELGLFYGQAIIDELSNLAKILLELKDLSDLTAAPILAGEVQTPDLNAALTEEKWAGNKEEDCHAKFYFSSVNTDLDLGNSGEKQFHLVLSALRLDGDAVSLGFARVTVREDGSSITPSTAVVSFFRLNLGFPEQGYDDATWHAWLPIIMADGEYSFDIEQAASSPTADFNSDSFRQSEGYPELLFPDDTWHRIEPVIMADGRYSMRIVQAASGAYVANSENWRVNLGYGELKYPDGTWHRIKSLKIDGRYSTDIEQTASPA